MFQNCGMRIILKTNLTSILMLNTLNWYLVEKRTYNFTMTWWHFVKKTVSIVHKICYLQSSYYKIIPEGVKFTSTLIHDSCKPTIQRFWFHF